MLTPCLSVMGGLATCLFTPCTPTPHPPPHPLCTIPQSMGIDPATEEAAEESELQAAAAALVHTRPGEIPNPATVALAASLLPRKRRHNVAWPEFPPPTLELSPAWRSSAAAPDGSADAMDVDRAEEDGARVGQEQEQGDGDVPPLGLADGLGSELLVCWSFLTSFSEVLGFRVPPAEGLLAALAEGEDSRLLADVHCALLRLLQADFEDAFDTGAITVGGSRVGRVLANQGRTRRSFHTVAQEGVLAGKVLAAEAEMQWPRVALWVFGEPGVPLSRYMGLSLHGPAISRPPLTLPFSRPRCAASRSTYCSWAPRATSWTAPWCTRRSTWRRRGRGGTTWTCGGRT